MEKINLNQNHQQSALTWDQSSVASDVSHVLQNDLRKNLDVNALSKYDPAFQKIKLSSQDIECLQEMVNRLKEDNSLENFFKEINLLPKAQPELVTIAGYLHFKVMFS